MATSLFFIYHQADAQYLSEIESQIQILVNNGAVIYWHQGKLMGGEEWRPLRELKLRESQIVLPLVSANLLASDDCMDLLKEAQNLGKEILPIIASDCLWDMDDILSQKTATPKKTNDTEATPITHWDKPAQAYTTIIRTIKNTVQRLQKTKSPTKSNIRDMPTPNLTFDNGYALLIGVGNYPNVNPLPETVDDAKVLYKLLTNPNRAGYPQKQVKLLTNQQATKQGITEGLDWLINNVQENPNATVILYYSGHGGIIDDKYFLVPYDYDPNNWQNSGITKEDFVAKVEKINTQKQIILLDCCHAAGITTKSINEKKVLSSNQLLYDQLNNGKGRVIIASSRADQTSLILPNAQYSAFTNVLIDALDSHADNGQGYATVLKALHYINTQLRKDTKDQQIPVFNLTNVEDFAICRINSIFARLNPFNKSLEYTGLAPQPTSPPIKPVENKPEKTKVNMDELKEQLLELIEENEFSQVFALIKANKNIFRGYKTFEDEYTLDNPTGTKLKQFKDRLTTFLNSKL